MKLTSGKEKIVLLRNRKSFFREILVYGVLLNIFLTFYILLLNFHLAVFRNF